MRQRALLARRQIVAWGWRIPFLIGCLIVPLIFVLRRSLAGDAGISRQEAPSDAARKSTAASPPTGRSSLQGMMLVVLTTVSFYFITVYTPDFGKSLNLSTSDSLLVTLLVAFTNFIWLPIGGALSDRIGREPVLLATGALMLVSPPIPR